MTKVLIAGGKASTGPSDTVEVLDVTKPHLKCQNLPGLPIKAPNAFGGLVLNEHPLVCPNDPVKMECYKLVNNKWLSESGMYQACLNEICHKTQGFSFRY